MKSIVPLFFLLFFASVMPQLHAGSGSDTALLLHWSFDRGQGTSVEDTSPNDLDGTVSADWAPAPGGHAVSLDGTSQKIVSVQLSEDKRFGKNSWTFSAMVKPLQFTIDAPQNQRRIFAFGTYPAAYLVIDIGGTGRLMCHFCHKDANGKLITTGGSSSIALARGKWSHIALVCNRETRKIWMYINGYAPQAVSMNPAFEGDFVLGGGLTVGSGWHNYMGLVDEVNVYRRALDKNEIAAEFKRLKPKFSIIESDQVLAAKKRAAAAASLDNVKGAWAKSDFETVRSLCRRVVNDERLDPQMRSYAHLRIAQSFQREKKIEDAKKAYKQIAATKAYPSVHRMEAHDVLKQISRQNRVDPQHDPRASRTSVPEISNFAFEVFVSPAGNDTNDGSRGDPFATLKRARNALRSAGKKGIKGPMAVRILPGTYTATETFTLDENDSGTEDAPIVYRAETFGKSIFYGGVKLSGFAPVTDTKVLERLPETARGKVLQCNLKALGITDYGELKVRGFAQPPSPPTLELFVNKKPMTVARWPDKGFVGIRRLIQPGSKADGTPSVFEYISDRHERWLAAEDPWLFGYFHFLWADATIKIGGIDPEKNTITTAEPYHYGGRGMSTRQGIQYYAFNLLEEIDTPGEWYLNRDAGILYLYPPVSLKNAETEISMLTTPMIELENVSHVRFEGLVFDLSRYIGIRAQNCRHCLITGCTVSRMAHNGIMIHGGEHNALIGCDIHTIGRRATEVTGGDRKTLTPAHHVVENCRIHFFGRIDRTYTPAIQLEGVGNRVAHNLMYNCPSSVMRIEGNDHLIEFNEVHNAVRESDDQGAMELFRNATYRGVVFRYNYYHQVGKTDGGTAVHGQAAIRLDDAISGIAVYGNVFHRCANGHFGAVQMNSGRDNMIDNNLFIDCRQGISGGWYPGNSVWKTLRAGNTPSGFYMGALYRSRYPKIATMLDDPGINHLWRNVFYKCPTIATRRANIDMLENAIYSDADPGFVNAAEGDFRLKPASPVFTDTAFRPIPFSLIGLYRDRYRPGYRNK